VDGGLRLRLVHQLEPGRWRMMPESNEDHVALLTRCGQVPLPCYICRGRPGEPDRERYQTIFAHQPGAVAAPTAGLHFTPRVFERLRSRGIGWTFVTLHVGAGTFQPIKVEDYRQHPMHPEWGQLSAESAAAIAACKARGGRVVAVGTTVVRVLETAAVSRSLNAWSGDTRLFIYPPYAFRVVDGLVTNFHLPRSTLLLPALLPAPKIWRRLIRRLSRTAIGFTVMAMQCWCCEVAVNGLPCQGKTTWQCSPQVATA
jgi:S-adenosylmethionine:tRNA ribosyltransferase-isomerase